VLLDHAGHTPDGDAIRAVNRLLAEIPVRLALDATGYRLHGFGAAPFRAGRPLADAIRRCSEDGSWHRLKVCARDTCRWAFYDASRNPDRVGRRQGPERLGRRGHGRHRPRSGTMPR